jgi:hypothetical protein
VDLLKDATSCAHCSHIWAGVGGTAAVGEGAAVLGLQTPGMDDRAAIIEVTIG